MESKVAVLERDLDHISGYFDRLDSAVEKLVDVSASLKEMIVVHEQKLTKQAETDQQLFVLVEERKKEITLLKSDLEHDLERLQTAFDTHKKEQAVVEKTVNRLKAAGTAVAIVIIFILSKLHIIPFTIPLINL